MIIKLAFFPSPSPINIQPNRALSELQLAAKPKMAAAVPESDDIAHCVILPYPNQGHLNPMLQFAKRLSDGRVRITVTLPRFSLKSIGDFSDGSISVRPISDGFDDGGRAQAQNFDEYIARFELVGRATLGELLVSLAADSGKPPACVVYDPFLPWALDVAEEHGVAAAAFFTQSCAVSAVYHRVQRGELRPPLPAGEAVQIPGLPPLRPVEMPSFIYVPGSYPGVCKMVVDQFRNVGRADWILFNTVHELEHEIIDSISKFWRVKAIGSTLPSMYIDQRLQEDTDYNINLIKPDTTTCLNWLDKQHPKSVIYVSFGSLCKLNIRQTQELARALVSSTKPFLWVVRSSEQAKLPKGFCESKHGLVVSWCPQLRVLAHSAVGCFMTHCGWNSIMEALSLGIPMVGVPQWTDQSTNAKFVADVWRVGLWAQADEEGLVREDEIITCIKRVMEGEVGEEIRRNSNKWRRKAIDDGGSSDKNIQEFVEALANRSTC